MKFKKTTLKNGLRIITVPMADNPAVTVLVLVEAGSKYEPKQVNGISHFLEHMVFKGTKNRPKASDISKELDGLGADYNAFTGNEYTGYHAKVHPKYFDRALDIISDMYLNPLFDEEEIKKEKGVIIEEIRMYKDLPQREVHHVLDALMFGDQPAGRTILGPEKNIRSFSQSHFRNYRKLHYVAKGTIVIISGNINEAQAIAKTKKIFAQIPNSKKSGKPKVKEIQTSPKIKIEYKDTVQTHLVFGIRTFSIFDKRNPTLTVLNSVLGRGMSSRLFTKMRDELGICYYIRSSDDSYTDHGMITIAAGVDNSRVKIAVENIMKEVRRLKADLVSPEELKKVKDYISGTTMLGLETSEDRADFVGGQEILRGKIEPVADLLKKIEKVRAEDVKRLANEIFKDKNLNLALIGPHKNEKALKKFLTFKN